MGGAYDLLGRAAVLCCRVSIAACDDVGTPADLLTAGLCNAGWVSVRRCC